MPQNLKCCQDASKDSKDSESKDTDFTLENQEKPLKRNLKLSNKTCDWKANSPPQVHDSCGNSPLMLRCIFKMNWVAKLVKYVDEMVSGCQIYDIAPSKIDGSCQDISDFKKRWVKGEPVIIKGVCDESSMLVGPHGDVERHSRNK
ncbi:hypothetical protein L2E82_41551 [Cichorium intybus]|uniref:Uncharacterized protein n=1 Tax=Cichorium intybus TaxID=13427 RepID=A0ACB9AP84_CICIN|nr:hypothetical protein L2E82_41551 [Cichorium intybus]